MMSYVHEILLGLINFLSISVGGVSIFWVMVVMTVLYIVWRLV